MANEAYERNFRGLANAIDTNARQSSNLARAQMEADRQHRDLVLRVTQLEATVQMLLVRTTPNGPGGS
jgi:hypothetical protein